MADEEVVVAEAVEADAPEAGEEKKDRWDELMAKLDDITETLRKACEGGAEPAAEGEAVAVAEEQQAKPEADEAGEKPAEDKKAKGKK